MLVKSEQEGIDEINSGNVVYSIGISSFGNAELAMAKKGASVIATTIDEKGLEDTLNKINGAFECKLEDVREKLTYPDDHFDFIYARLVLHYLSKQELESTLNELKRVLKNEGKLYVVVRSEKEWELNQPGVTHDENTDFTSYPLDFKGEKLTRTRRFYTIDKLKDSFCEFACVWAREFEERLYHDFQRSIPVEKPNQLISGLFVKSSIN